MATVTVNDIPIRYEDSGGLVMVQGGAHAPNMSHPDVVNEALVGFLTSL